MSFGVRMVVKQGLLLLHAAACCLILGAVLDLPKLLPGKFKSGQVVCPMARKVCPTLGCSGSCSNGYCWQVCRVQHAVLCIAVPQLQLPVWPRRRRLQLMESNAYICAVCSC